MRSINYWSLLVIFSLGLAGCNVTFPQVDSAISAVRSQLAKQSELPRSPEIRWSASFKGEGRLMRAFTENGLTLFVSEEEDAIAFDGWVVRSLGGFGDSSILSIIDTGNARRYKSGAAYEASHPTQCGNWTNSSNEGGNVVWRQVCNRTHEPNSITLNQQGLIVAIDQVVDSDGNRLSLRKL